tara:strand:+ start:440 stop:2791 length:2352 start_codon:yes stop_codon:yes gene_type:complete
MRGIMRRHSNNIKLETMKDKSTLVKLLAEEDVTVSYQSVPTASFNVETREVTLPIWKDKSEDVMDMMSLHEVGHALYTPMDLMEKGKEKKVSHSFLNVLEDVRIEKMIQDKYLGSRKVFKKAYKELISKDFFGVKDKDLSKLNLIDRINMHYKNVPNVPFDDDELEWVKKANQTKTSDDVVNLAVEMQDYMKDSEKENESDEEFVVQINMPSDEKTEDDNKEDNTEQKSADIEIDVEEKEDETPKGNNTSSEQVEADKKPTEETEQKGFSKGAEGNDDESIQATTDNNYQKKQYEAVDKNATGINYLNIPKVNLKNAIVDYKEINAELNEHYLKKAKLSPDYAKHIEWNKKDLAKYKNDQKATISYMVKEFEMKKSADLYKRSTVSKTGSLNMDKLHSYAYNEDIFLKMNVEPSATNHGLVMFIDWSGSMSDNFKNTIKQALNLVWFCERVNIPFEVYGFTNGYGRRDDTNKNLFIQDRKHNDIVINELTLINMLSSRANKKEMINGLNNLYLIANYYDSYNRRYSWEEREKVGTEIYPQENYSLNSTPLNHSIIAAMDIMPKFKKDNGLQKVHTVFLTDGYSNSLNDKYTFRKQHKDMYGDLIEEGVQREDMYKDFGYDDSVITKLTDPVTKKVWQGENKKGEYSRSKKFIYSTQTPVLIEFLKNRVPGMNVVNFFIAGKNRKGTISKTDIEAIFDINWNDHEKIKKIQKELRTKNVAVVTNQAWTEMYVLPGGVKLDTSTEDLSDVQVGAKKGELKRAFGKMTSGRKNQRPLLNKFIGMIA